jgi:hypothetical protein
LVKDFGGDEVIYTFRAETEIQSNSTNGPAFKRLRELLDSPETVDRNKEIVSILHREVNKLGSRADQALKARNLFSVSFGLPPESGKGK